MNKKLFVYQCIIVITGLIIHPNFSIAQNENTNRQLAQQYYRNKEFDKAAVLYGELFQKSYSKVYFTYYLKSLIEIKEYTEAERVIKKQIRRHKAEMNYHVELGYLYKIEGKIEKSGQEYNYAIKNVVLDHQQIVRLANTFLAKREYAYAEKLYLTASKKLGDMYDFSFEIANLYYYSRDFDKMIDTYLSILAKNKNYIQTVQNRLQNSIYSDVNDNLKDLLKQKLIEQIQKHPNKLVLNELLIWLYVQQKEFDKALIQVIALDKRNNEDGERVIALARLANSNKNYKVAVNAYKYILEKGRNNYYYYTANNEYLNLLFNQIVTKKNYNDININELESKYKETIKELGLNSGTAIMMKNMAHLQAFYLNNSDEAIKNLENTLKVGNLSVTTIADCKLELADIYLLQNRVWDATMLYAQVELENKNNPTGSNAKFKKATLAYYLGDFLWAKAQLDVLKASTSKLIANDAFALSKLIEDNSILDENDEALQKYARAQLLHYQNKDSLSIESLDSIFADYSGHPLIDEAYFFKAKIFDSQKQYGQALKLYNKVYQNYGYENLGDDALFRMAEINEKYLHDKEKAQKFYEEILLKYPESSFTVIARERFRLLRGDKLQ
ncbi:MAG: hypothetical protein GXO79_09440 [Chlorobi bacterium]|nr:hypothetical protein [Chlorobiota bacterium]